MEHIEKQLGKMNRTLHIIDDKIYTEEEVKKIRGW